MTAPRLRPAAQVAEVSAPPPASAGALLYVEDAFAFDDAPSPQPIASPEEGTALVLRLLRQQVGAGMGPPEVLVTSDSEELIEAMSESPELERFDVSMSWAGSQRVGLEVVDRDQVLQGLPPSRPERDDWFTRTHDADDR
ncbi:MAG: hypothetical protein IPJ65_38865 [Archangiaceae bacterium]|nr:hypothetical protein [Archangiaceae bacterium]